MYTCVQSWKQWTLPVITTIALWQLMHLGTWGTSPSLVHELPQSDCGVNRESTLFSWSQIYYAHLASVRFKYFVLSVSWITFEHYIYIYIMGTIFAPTYGALSMGCFEIKLYNVFTFKYGEILAEYIKEN